MNANGGFDSGLMEYSTVYSREPNFHSDGSALVNLNDANQVRDLFRTNSITVQPPPTLINYRGLLDFYIQATQAGLTEQQFQQIVGDITVSTARYTRGRVNINTASAQVLSALFQGIGVDSSTADSAAQQLVDYRNQNTANLGSIGWLVDCLGRTSQVVQRLQTGDYITTRAFQFSADIAATGPYGRGYRRVRFVFDISGGTPKIIFREDLSRLGWALGQNARQTWVAQN